MWKTTDFTDAGLGFGAHTITCSKISRQFPPSKCSYDATNWITKYSIETIAMGNTLRWKLSDVSRATL